MASAGDGGRPRLPDTDDPFVLLGLAEDADGKAIRQAYARLIKVYRPDRAPVEFQRVHAAFEEVQARRPRPARPDDPAAPAPWTTVLGRATPTTHAATRASPAHAQTGKVPEPNPAGVNPAASAPSGPHGPGAPSTDEPGAAEDARTRAVIDQLEQAAAHARRGDHAAAATIVNRLLDERVPLDLLATRDDHAQLVAQHAELSWTRLASASRDGAAIRALWELAWDHAVRHEVERARVLLDDDRLRLDAGDDPELAAACLFRIGALAWRLGRSLDPLLARYRAALPPHPALDPLLDDIALDVHAAPELRSALEGTSLAPLLGLLGAARFGSRAERRIQAQAMLAALERDVGTEKRRYERSVRPGLARAVLALPITTWVVARWVRINGRLAGRLSRFDLAIDADAALYTLSMFAAAARVIGELAPS